MPWIGAAIGAVGGLFSSGSASDAADTQAGAANNAAALSNQQYQQTRTDSMPALEARNASLAKMRQLLGIDGGSGSMGGTPTASDVMGQPGYQFGLSEGQRALSNTATAQGMRNSGAALKAASRYGTDYATTKYNDAFNQLQSSQTNQFNRLASVAGAGQTGANTIASTGAQNAEYSGNALRIGANAKAAGSIASTNALIGGANQLAGWYANSTKTASPSNSQLEQMYGFGG